MKKNNFFSHLNVSEQEFNELLAQSNYACNADGRKAFRQQVKVTNPRPIPNIWTHYGWGDSPSIIDMNTLLFNAREIGGCPYGQTYDFPTPHGMQKAVVTLLNNAYGQSSYAPTYVTWFSGYMNPWVAMEVIRFYVKKHGKLPEFLALGKGGNKGLFQKVYNREQGLIIGSEAEAYCNIMSLMAPESYARKHQQAFQDMDTAGNLRELYRFLKEQGLKEANIIIVTGQAWYDRRVLAEWMLMLREQEFSDVKLNLTLAHSPVWLKGNSPDTRLSEISLGYAAASLWPITKDTVPLGSNENGERYLLPDLAHPNMLLFEELIRHYNNMGWPNGSENLFGTSHEQAVKEIMLADLFAEASFTAEAYDKGVRMDIAIYKEFVGKFKGKTEEEFRQWCLSTPDKTFR